MADSHSVKRGDVEAATRTKVLGDDADAHRLDKQPEAEADPHVVELKTKVSALVAERFGGDYHKAFTHYDSDNDGGINSDELGAMLKDAGVGSGFTRGMWASKIIDKMDSDKDGKISWHEFQAGLKG